MRTPRLGDPSAPADVSGAPERRNDALLAVYFAKRETLVRFFAAKTGSMAAAEDLTQELYLKISGYGGERLPQHPAAWIFKMASNLALDHARSERRSAARDSAWRSVTVVSLAQEDVAPEPPVDEAVAARQELGRLIAAVAALPPQMRRAFRLHKLQGLSHGETARAMGISTKAVEKHISAALKALTRALRR